MYYSLARWLTKSTALVEFLKLTSKSAQNEAVKDQIRIRILDFGWDDLHYAWSNIGVDRSPQNLLNFLADISIPQQSQRGIPKKPKVTLPLRRDNRPKLGSISWDIIMLD